MTSRPWLKHYDPGVPPHLDYPAVPVFHFLDEAARLCPERPCTIFGSDTLTYRQVAEYSDRIASALRGMGVREEERLGICMPNCPEFVLAYFGILKAGAVVVAINPLYTPPEIIHQVNDAGVQTVFCTASLYNRLKTARPETKIDRIIVTGEASPQPGDMNFNDLLAAKPSPSGESPQEHNKTFDTSGTSGTFGSSGASGTFVPSGSSGTLPSSDTSGTSETSDTSDQIALFQYTGGTTGIAKAAVCRHRNLVANTLQFKAWMSTLEQEKETFLLALPIYHIYGMVCGMLLGMALRASLVIIPNPRDIPELLSAIQIHHVSYFPAAPDAVQCHQQRPAGGSRAGGPDQHQGLHLRLRTPDEADQGEI